LKPKRNVRKVKTLKICPEFKVLEGGFCSSETKHDRRTAPRPRLLVSKRRLQK
jgi:hypothetical protein